jgi:hypothetical protein
MGWADDMHEEGYTEEHGGLMDDAPSRSPRSKRYKPSKGKNKSGPGSKWTEDDCNQLFGMYIADVSIKNIAKKLNRTPHAIAYQLYLKNKISESVRLRFKGESSYDASFSTINRDIYKHDKLFQEISIKGPILKMEKDKFRMNETVKSILILVIAVLLIVSIR